MQFAEAVNRYQEDIVNVTNVKWKRKCMNIHLHKTLHSKTLQFCKSANCTQSVIMKLLWLTEILSLLIWDEESKYSNSVIFNGIQKVDIRKNIIKHLTEEILNNAVEYLYTLVWGKQTTSRNIQFIKYSNVNDLCYFIVTCRLTLWYFSCEHHLQHHG